MMKTPGLSLLERGKVREISGNRVTIIPDRSAACFGCMNMECKAGGGFLIAENPLGLPVETGQMVEAQTDAVSLIPQALTAFLPPNLGFTAGFIPTRRLIPGAGEAVAAFAGLALFFSAAFTLYKARRGKPGGTSYTVTRIL
jgi:positive regulator of sigma E activity